MKTLNTIFCLSMKKNIRFYLKFSVIFSLVLILSGIWIPGLVSICYAQSPWSQKSDLPNARFAHSSIAMEGKIYTMGGATSTGGPAYKTVKVYDPMLDIWASTASMITGRANFSTCVVNGKIWAIGGGSSFYGPPLNTIEEYDPVTDTWKHNTNMPRARVGLTASLVNGKIYVIGGGDSGLEPIPVVDVYDTLTKTWTTVADLPTPRLMLTTVILNGKIYAVGGMVGPSGGEIALTTLEEYDPVTDTWTKKAEMSIRRKYVSACVLNGKIYVFGGTSGFCTPSLSSVEVYDPVTDTWREIASMPSVLCAHSVASLNGKAYISGGISTQYCPSTAVSMLYEYNSHNDLLLLIEKIEVNKGFAKAGIDSVCIATKIKDPSGITLLVEIEAPDQTPVDSLQLFDDGNHGDGNAGDSIYANFWPVNFAEERYYYVDLHITRTDTETVFYPIDNIGFFTTIGPVVYENYTFSDTDTIPNPGDIIYLNITLRNNGSTVTATNIKATLSSLDPLVSISTGSRNFGDIAAGENKSNIGVYRIEISENWADETKILFVVDISSDGNTFWSDTFSIPEEPVNIKDIREPVARIYPNPADNILNIEISNTGKQGLEIEILTVAGQVIYQKEYKNANADFVEQLDLSGYTKGIYLVKVKLANTVYVGKVVVR
jgi:N-acetylneuraminic acid mutarotase